LLVQASAGFLPPNRWRTRLAAVKPGDKIKFAPDRVNGQFVITKIEKAR
jgi:Copper binding periplasmic protein CusF